MDLLAKQISTKLSMLHAVCGKIVEMGLRPPSFSEHVSELQETYIMKTAYLFSPDRVSRDDARAQLVKVVSEENIIELMDLVAERTNAILKAGLDDPVYRSDIEKLKLPQMMEKYVSTITYSLDDFVSSSDYARCTQCNIQMFNDVDSSELHCPECGAVCRLVGTIYADSASSIQEKSKTRSGQFNPNRHFQFWWQHILAREPEEELGEQHGEKLLARLRAIIRRDNKILRLLTVTDVRKMLKEIGNHATKLNKNVPLIMKKLTGIGPPNVSDDFSHRVEKLFTKAIEIGEKKRRKGRINRNYYPFYIAKIVDAITPESDFETKRLLYYIYLQSDTTIEKDDADWEDICESMPEITFEVTDRTKFLKYRLE